MWIEERELVTTPYTVTVGSFGLANSLPINNADGVPVTNIDSWHACREVFLNLQAGTRVMYFKHDLSHGRGKSIAEFMDKVEKKLNIKSNRRTNIQATNKKKIVKIMVAAFWDQSEMRRSLFTALIRAAQNYRISANEGDGNFEGALYSVPYTRETSNAIDRFLNKRATHYQGGNSGIRGWQTVFQNASPSQVTTLLKTTKK